MPILSSKLLYVQFLGFHMIYNVENKIFDDVLGRGGEACLAVKTNKFIGTLSLQIANILTGCIQTKIADLAVKITQQALSPPPLYAFLFNPLTHGIGQNCPSKV